MVSPGYKAMAIGGGISCAVLSGSLAAVISFVTLYYEKKFIWDILVIVFAYLGGATAAVCISGSVLWVIEAKKEDGKEKKRHPLND